MKDLEGSGRCPTDGSSIGRGIGQNFSVWRAWRQWCRGDVGGWAPPLRDG